jgi:hypothetical protein
MQYVHLCLCAHLAAKKFGLQLKPLTGTAPDLQTVQRLSMKTRMAFARPSLFALPLSSSLPKQLVSETANVKHFQFAVMMSLNPSRQQGQAIESARKSLNAMLVSTNK